MEWEWLDTKGWSPDGELRLADWTKQAWDLPTEVDEFIAALGITQDTLPSVRAEVMDHFMRLPAAEAMPEALRKELTDRGYLPERR